MPMPDPAPMPGAPGTHLPFRPTLEQRADLDRQYPQARDHARAVVVARAITPESPSQDWPRRRPAAETAQVHRTRRAGHELAVTMDRCEDYLDTCDLAEVLTPGDGDYDDVLDCAARFELGGAL